MLLDQRASPLPVSAARTPGAVRQASSLTGHSLRSFTRNPLGAFFTLLFPLAFLALVSALVGDAPLPDGSGVRIVQVLVAPFAAFGVSYAAFVILSGDTAGLRDGGVLKRWRGAPVPTWTVVTSRVLSAMVVSLVAVVILTTVGVAAYGVQMQWAKVPAMAVTLLVGIACFAALGMALVALVRSSTAVQAVANGVLIPLAFISDVFLVGVALPVWLDRVGDALPLKHFVAALRETFDPSAAGAGFAPAALAIVAAWGLAGGLVAWRLLDWEPRRPERPRPAVSLRGARVAGLAPEAAGAVPTGSEALRPAYFGRPTTAALLAGQAWYALTGLRRDVMSVFFTIIFPALLLLLFPYVYGPDAEVQGLRLAQFMLPAMMTWAVAVSAYVNLPEMVARSRERGVHKRLRGTPLPWHSYLSGQTAAAAGVSALALTLLLAAGTRIAGATVLPQRLPAIVVAALLGTACMAALGFALLAIIPDARTITAVTLGTLLPLSFVSEVFLIGPDDLLPRGLRVLGDVLPLKHLMHALLTATRPDQGGAGFAWSHLAVVAAWLVAGIAVALILPRHRR